MGIGSISYELQSDYRDTNQSLIDGQLLMFMDCITFYAFPLQCEEWFMSYCVMASNTSVSYHLVLYVQSKQSDQVILASHCIPSLQEVWSPCLLRAAVLSLVFLCHSMSRGSMLGCSILTLVLFISCLYLFTHLSRHETALDQAPNTWFALAFKQTWCCRG